MYGHFSLKESLALSDQGKNVHVKLLRLCACLLEEFFRKKENLVRIKFCLVNNAYEKWKHYKRMVCDSPLLESLFKFEVWDVCGAKERSIKAWFWVRLGVFSQNFVGETIL